MKKYMKFMIPAIIVMVMGCIGTAVNVIYHSPYYTFKRAFDRDNVADARRIYSENKDNERFVSQAEKLVSDYYDEQKEGYLENRLGYTEAVSHINSYSIVYSGSDIIGSLAKIEDSRENFDKGRQYQENKDYRAAIDAYELVSEEDDEHFSLAADKIAECKTSIITDAISKCNEYLDKKKYKDSYDVLVEVEKDFSDEQITSKKEEVKQKYNDEIIKLVKNYLSRNVYLDAIRYMDINRVKELDSKETEDLYNSTEDAYIDYVMKEAEDILEKGDIDECITYLNDVMATCRYYGVRTKEISNKSREVADLFVAEIVSKADKYASEGKYNAAISIIEEAKEKYDAPEFDSKITEYKTKRDKEVISTYKSVVVCSYDYIEDKYKLKAKGVGDADYVHPDKRNMEPVITVKGEDVFFSVHFEYLYTTRNFEYFRTDKLLVQCDDKQYVFKIEYSDVKSDSEYSYPNNYYMEWIAILHFDFLSSKDGSTLINMTDFAQDIINAKSITLRFYDGGMKRDFYVSKNEITEFKNMWNLYTMLKDNPSAIEYIT